MGLPAPLLPSSLPPALPPFLQHFKGYLIKGHCLLTHILAAFLQVQVTLTFHFSKFLELKLKRCNRMSQILILFIHGRGLFVTT